MESHLWSPSRIGNREWETDWVRNLYQSPILVTIKFAPIEISKFWKYPLNKKKMLASITTRHHWSSSFKRIVYGAVPAHQDLRLLHLHRSSPTNNIVVVVVVVVILHVVLIIIIVKLFKILFFNYFCLYCYYFPLYYYFYSYYY